MDADQTGPRWATALAGHQSQQQAFLDAVASHTLHHAWLLTGAEGLGKATFAWLAAKHILCGAGVSDGPGLFGDPDPVSTLIADPDHPLVHRIAVGGHGDVRLLERCPHPKTGKLRTEITVDQIQGLSSLFTLSASEGGWRVVIIDSVDDLNRNAANALLKVLEEPPEECIFFLVSHRPGRLLPTIRSRCRLLAFSSLGDDDMMAALAQNGVGHVDPLILGLSSGSPGAAIHLVEQDMSSIMGDMAQLAAVKGAVSPDILKPYQGSEALTALALSCLQILFSQLAGGRSIPGLAAFLDPLRALYAGTDLADLVMDLTSMAQKQQGLRIDRSFFWIALTETLRDRRTMG